MHDSLFCGHRIVQHQGPREIVREARQLTTTINTCCWKNSQKQRFGWDLRAGMIVRRKQERPTLIAGSLGPSHLMKDYVCCMDYGLNRSTLVGIHREIVRGTQARVPYLVDDVGVRLATVVDHKRGLHGRLVSLVQHEPVIAVVLRGKTRGHTEPVGDVSMRV